VSGNIIKRSSHFDGVPVITAGVWRTLDGDNKPGDFSIMKMCDLDANIAIRCQGSLQFIGQVVVGEKLKDLIKNEQAKKKTTERPSRNGSSFLFLLANDVDEVAKRLVALKKYIENYCAYTNMGWAVSINTRDLLKIYMNTTINSNSTAI